MIDTRRSIIYRMSHKLRLMRERPHDPTLKHQFDQLKEQLRSLNRRHL
jgi:hypothetical protein